jgi:hypothetical protein
VKLAGGQPVLDTLSAVRLVIKHQAELRSDRGATQSGVAEAKRNGPSDPLRIFLLEA